MGFSISPSSVFYYFRAGIVHTVLVHKKMDWSISLLGVLHEQSFYSLKFEMIQSSHFAFPRQRALSSLSTWGLLLPSALSRDYFGSLRWGETNDLIWF